MSELVKHFAAFHDVAAVALLEFEAREHEMGGGGADVDADAGQLDFVFVDDVTVGVGKKYAAALGFLGHLELAYSYMCRLDKQGGRGVGPALPVAFCDGA